MTKKQITGIRLISMGLYGKLISLSFLIQDISFWPFISMIAIAVFAIGLAIINED